MTDRAPLPDQRITVFGGRRGEKREQAILALMDAIQAGKTVHVAAPTREQADALYAEAKRRIEKGEL